MFAFAFCAHQFVPARFHSLTTAELAKCGHNMTGYTSRVFSRAAKTEVQVNEQKMRQLDVDIGNIVEWAIKHETTTTTTTTTTSKAAKKKPRSDHPVRARPKPMKSRINYRKRNLSPWIRHGSTHWTSKTTVDVARVKRQDLAGSKYPGNIICGSRSAIAQSLFLPWHSRTRTERRELRDIRSHLRPYSLASSLQFVRSARCNMHDIAIGMESRAPLEFIGSSNVTTTTTSKERQREFPEKKG